MCEREREWKMNVEGLLQEVIGGLEEHQRRGVRVYSAVPTCVILNVKDESPWKRNARQ